MATYFFQWRCGTERVDDEDGRELPDLAAAVRAATGEMRGLIGQEATEGQIRLAQRIEIEDEAHRVVHRVVVRDVITFI
ncbi:hypothetical protein Q5H91_08450 [Sphingomonas sp. KR1UV-12]|uniref:DUF6894 domain-containing protein n=1 Tax=Sphingomonas aurea TaxID=3063994 RepID=A0ABT9EJW9_9SPHN|nr:hypothetical protein [Sphingomonas sp. KR1UV-12]MDP1027239.1 hypothetical protein [Sphingomonas sp. KR1UV-12]